MKKTLLLLLLFSILFLSIPEETLADAEEVKIVCDGESDCKTVPEQPVLFSQTSFVPGTILSKEVVFHNTHPRYGCSVSFQTHPTEGTSQELATVLQLSLYQAAYPQQLVTPVLLATLFSRSTPTTLLIVNPNAVAHTTWQILFPQNADNTYQNKTTSFFFTFHTMCGPDFHAPLPPTALPTSSPVPTASPPPHCVIPISPTDVTAVWKEKKLRISWTTQPAVTYHITIHALETNKQFDNIQVEHASHWDVAGLSTTETHRVDIRSSNRCGMSEPVLLTVLAKEKAEHHQSLPSATPATQSGIVLGATTTVPQPIKQEYRNASSAKRSIILLYAVFCFVALLWLFFFLFWRKKRDSSSQE